MKNIIIQNSNENLVIQGSNNSTCTINGKKYVNGIEVKENTVDLKSEGIKELQIVSKEIATQLEELGFDWNCDMWYEAQYELPHKTEYVFSKGTKAPTQALVVKWFRDVFNISIEPLTTTQGIQCNICYYEKESLLVDECYNTYFDTYELAEETGILKAIEILKNKQN